MRASFPLYSKILVWLCLNLLLLAVMAGGLAAGYLGLDLLVAGRAGERIRAVRDQIHEDLEARPPESWDGALDHYSEAHHVRFLLFNQDGTQVAGEQTALPDEVRVKLVGARPGDGRRDRRPEREEMFAERGPPRRPERERRDPQPFSSPSFRGEQGRSPRPGMRISPLSQPQFIVRSRNPTRYWVGMYSFLRNPQGDPRQRSILLIVADSVHGGGLFLDLTPVWWVGGASFLISVLFWLPLVRRITGAVGQLTLATEKIAQGRFDGRVRLQRRDELGQLGEAVNRMAERLQGFVSGQKRFLGDIAHELCTPIARLQMAVGVLEQRADPAVRPHIQDVREEVEHMSRLVEELLSFSKASLMASEVKRELVNVGELARQAARRERSPESEFELEAPDDLVAWANPQLLQRALANLLRNAVRYAGEQGPIQLRAKRDRDNVVVRVTDCGSGIPEEFLNRLFDPFFRVDDARTREAGGVGLGLTIVKTCVEACGGTVVCRNRQPHGLEVEIRLAASAPKSDTKEPTEG